MRWALAAGLLRPKHNLSPLELRLLALVAAIPFAIMLLRLLALPGVLPPGGSAEWLRSLGNALSQSLSLAAVPAGQREHVLYLLSVPFFALMVTLARLTFGIRVLGFRSILLAVGFQHSGVIPSLILITVVVATIAVVRPWLRRIRLPYYARVSVILCIVAMTMVGALLASPWMQSDVLWGIAYFPVIVLGMLAEGIAHTLDHDNAITAAWRALTTILLAFVMALVVNAPAVGTALLQFPELALVQIVAIVLVAEYLDFRWFQDWDTRAAGIALPRLLSREGAYRIAVVRGGAEPRGDGSENGQRAARSVRKVVDALRRAGHSVHVADADTRLLGELRQYIPPHPRTGEPGGLVLDLTPAAAGRQAAEVQVPSLLETAGFAYAGPSPRGRALEQDWAAAKTLLVHAGVPTPGFCLMAGRDDATHGLRYPLRVRPRYEPHVPWRLATDRDELERVVRRVVREHRQEAIVEEELAGRDLHVALLGNEPLECLPLVELVRSPRRERICPADVDAKLANALRAHAKNAFWTCGGRDYARVHVRVTESGLAWVIGLRSRDLFASGGSFARAANAAGMNTTRLLCRVIEIARSRYLEGERARPPIAATKGDAATRPALRKVFPLR